MSRGLPYDSDGGRDYAGVAHGHHDRRGLRAVRADRARSGRPVPRLRAEPRAVPARDAEASRRGEGHQRRRTFRPTSMAAAKAAWDDAVRLGELYGYRNAQATVLAPTGTIGFMMDCDTTGRRAGHRAGEIQEAGRRRLDEDRQPDRADGAGQARLHRAADQGDHRLHRPARDHRRGAGAEAGAPAGVRLRVQGAPRASGRSTTWGTSR